MKVVLTSTEEPCWRCGGKLDRLTPEVQGWQYHCQVCQHLTSTVADLRDAMTSKPEGSVGVVASVKCHIQVIVSQ